MACKQQRQPEPEITLRELLVEQIRVITEALPDGTTFHDWLFGDCDFDTLVIGDDVHREACAFAYGYLRGAHEALDMTLSELLESEDIDVIE